jgi:hypothetical protein
MKTIRLYPYQQKREDWCKKNMKKKKKEEDGESVENR